MKSKMTKLALAALVITGMTGCDSPPSGPELPTGPTIAESRASHGAPEGLYAFSGPVFDIAAAPDGSILVGETVFGAIFPTGGESISTIKEIRGGSVQDVIQITTMAGSPINGLDAVGRRSLFATSGALDAATGGHLWHVTQGRARMVADLGAFERAHDPDAFAGDRWKTQACEPAPYTAGPQSNPYHLTALSGSTALVADAAGNTLLRATISGAVDWVAIFNPPLDESGEWMVAFPLDDDTDCYVQPVPTSVAIGPDGAYYVGELTGITAANLRGEASTGLSRVWRIEPGAMNVVCPSASCRVALSGLTAVIDVAFGPDGMLYVLEYDENGWLAPFDPRIPLVGGTLNRCDVRSGACHEIAGDLMMPGAITFDKRGDLWMLENNLFAPTARRVSVR